MSTHITQESSKHLQVPISYFNGSRGLDESLQNLIKQELEGRCNNYGYILPDTVQITSKSSGKIISVNKISKIEYLVNYQFQSILPSPGDTYTCKVDSQSKMGLIAYLHNYDSLRDSPLILIIPNIYLKDGKSYSEAETLSVEVIESRIKYKNTQIQVVCKPSY